MSFPSRESHGQEFIKAGHRGTWLSTSSPSPQLCRQYSRTRLASPSLRSFRLLSSSSSLIAGQSAHMAVDSDIRTFPRPARVTKIGCITVSVLLPNFVAPAPGPPLTRTSVTVFAAYRIKHVAEHNLPSWLTKPLPIAHLPMENTVHYDLGKELGILEWNNATLPGPNYDGVVWLTMEGGERKPFTFSLFHQLRCLNIVRDSLIARRHPPYAEPSRVAIHCMNYLRQMVMCRADLTLESARHPTGPNTVVSDVTHVCRDWSVIWDEVEGNESYHRK